MGFMMLNFGLSDCYEIFSRFDDIFEIRHMLENPQCVPDTVRYPDFSAGTFDDRHFLPVNDDVRVESPFKTSHQFFKRDSGMYSSEVMAICRESLSRLPVLTSEIFMDRLRGLSYKEIAEKYSISHRSVTYEISKTLAVLKESLKDYLPLVLYLLTLKNN